MLPLKQSILVIYGVFSSTGNDALHQLTKTRVALHVSLTSLKLTTVYAEYGNFSIEDEANKYKLHINGWIAGTLGN